VNSILGKCHDGADGDHVFQTVGQMREDVTCVVVPPETLNRTPNEGQSAEKAHEAGSTRSAALRLVPAFDVDTKEKFNILLAVGDRS